MVADVSPRLVRGRRVITAAAAVIVGEGVLLGLGASWGPEAVPPEQLTPFALTLGGASGVLVVYGWPALEELRGQRIVLASRSKVQHAVTYAALVALVGVGLLVDLAARLVVALPWAFPLGTLTFLGLPLGLAALFVVGPRVARWIGVGPARPS